VGETFLAGPEQAASYCGEDMLHAAFNFDFAENRWHPKRFLISAIKWNQLHSNGTWPNNFLSNHDMHRAATRYCHGEDDRRAKVAGAMLLTLKNTPFIYNGEEIGLRDIPVRRKADVKDPVGRTFWPFYKGRDGCRAPMHWNGTTHAGFSQANPWLPVHANFPERNVEQQLSDPDSLLNFFKQIIQVRKAEPALQRGDFVPLVKDPRHYLAYLRTYGNDQVLVVLNFSSRDLIFDMPDGTWTSLLEAEQSNNGLIVLDPYDVRLFKQVC
jgi:alpha-glucosidase